MAIRPNAEQFGEYTQSSLDGEVVMLNLLKFTRPDGESVGSGRDAYDRYGDAVVKMVEAQGGRLVWGGSARHVFIGDVDTNDWDAVVLVSYPSRKAFLDMISAPAYREIHSHREDGLADTVVIACAPFPGFRTGEE